MSQPNLPKRPYNPAELDRELAEYYIKATEAEIKEMEQTVGVNDLYDVYSHIAPEDLFQGDFNIGEKLEYNDLEKHVFEISNKNTPVTSFIGDGLTHYKPSPIVGEICGIRGPTTAYTPYQPERSQGTLQTLWVYQTALSELTGFEAINASLYERSTGTFEAIKCAERIKRKPTKTLIIDSLYPGDREVLETMVAHTDTEIEFLPLAVNGQADTMALQAKLASGEYGVVVFAQVTNLGTLENCDAIVDIASEFSALTIGVIDPILLTNGGLKAPAEFGSNGQGCDIIVGEAQNLSLGKNFGGPGLGVFGIRFNEQNKTSIRQTPGRYVGLAQDIKGKECKAMILSTREQHIRREKATSNICSNQSFVASLAGANLLHWGTKGLTAKITKARDNCLKFLNEVLTLEGVTLAFEAPFFNEVTLKIEGKLEDLIEKGHKENLEIGLNISDRASNGNLLKVFFNDEVSEADLNKLTSFFKANFSSSDANAAIPEIPANYLRSTEIHIQEHSAKEIVDYYKKLGAQNISPDDGVYPLGSCTMKYNPYINDYCASFEGFTTTHPQSDEKFIQGNLELLYNIQELFKGITGLPGVTTQPVAGAQGELVGLKLFQAYHADRKEDRNLILIPRSAHGTNPATAAVAGYDIKILGSTPEGLVDLNEIDEIISKEGSRIAGVMVTNPNTAGILEKDFKAMADKIHDCGGLVYMDGANMNAIAGIVNLNNIGVDAVHNNLHKTWTIPHGGGGPGDAIVAVSEKLIPYLPGMQIEKINGIFKSIRPAKSMGSIHRHWGNFAHKVRCYTYIKALGTEGVRKMSAFSVLSARYLFEKLKPQFPTLPANSQNVPRMHEFIITLSEDTFKKITEAGVPKALIIARIGKLFLDFGFHAPTVAFPEQYGLMIEPTESFSKGELDEFAQVVLEISRVINEKPEVLITTPHFTPISRVDEVGANKNIVLVETKVEGKLFAKLPDVLSDEIEPKLLKKQGAEKLLSL